MYTYLNASGQEVKVGVLTVTAEIRGEVAPIDRTSAEEIAGVWTADGCALFALGGREYSQSFYAAWLADGTFDVWDADAPLMSYNETDGDYREATAEEIALLETAAGGPAALFWALSKARCRAVEAAKSDALEYLKECAKSGEA